jgi:hypothetical protein
LALTSAQEGQEGALLPQDRSGQKPMRYNPALDGLRAVAIALVILLHCYPRAMPSGWVGVDVLALIALAVGLRWFGSRERFDEA